MTDTETKVKDLITRILNSGLNHYQLTVLIDEMDRTDNDNAREWNEKLAKDWAKTLDEQDEIKKQQKSSWEATM